MQCWLVVSCSSTVRVGLAGTGLNLLLIRWSLRVERERRGERRADAELHLVPPAPPRPDTTSQARQGWEAASKKRILARL